ncbi:MAG: FecR domain-containing protein [Candidatus Lambdaproteobacteria bacterium]|nr:FecR domain-containing protein [Candidatus Lambdaproteobacteria bacterium]
MPLLIALLGLILPINAAPSWAQAPETKGTVVIRQGVVKLGRFGEETLYKELNRPIRIYEGDIIQTGPGSRAEVHLTADADTIQMYSNSFLRIEAVQREKTWLGLSIGKALFAVLHQTQADKRYRIRSQTVVIGVKGTRFALGSEEDKSYVLALEGEVTANNLEQPDAPPVRLTADEVYFVAKGKPVEPPMKVSAEVRQAIVTEDGLDTFQRIERDAERRRSGWTPPVTWTFRPYLHGGPIVFALDIEGGGQAFTQSIEANNGFVGFQADSSVHVALDVAIFSGTPQTMALTGDLQDSFDAQGNYAATAIAVTGVLNLGPLRLWGGLGFFAARLDVAPRVGALSAEPRHLDVSGPLVKVGLDMSLWRLYAGVTAFTGPGTSSSGSLLDEQQALGRDVTALRFSGASALLGLNF